MDAWNPILAETHIKRLALWKLLAAEALFIGLAAPAVIAVVWWFAAILFSLERVSS